jgi:hypothetical protein
MIGTKTDSNKPVQNERGIRGFASRTGYASRVKKSNLQQSMQKNLLRPLPLLPRQPAPPSPSPTAARTAVLYSHRGPSPAPARGRRPLLPRQSRPIGGGSGARGGVGGGGGAGLLTAAVDGLELRRPWMGSQQLRAASVSPSPTSSAGALDPRWSSKAVEERQVAGPPPRAITPATSCSGSAAAPPA